MRTGTMLMSASRIKRDKGATRSDNVYERLREAIVTGRARPNERLVETELAGQPHAYTRGPEAVGGRGLSSEPATRLGSARTHE